MPTEKQRKDRRVAVIALTSVLLIVIVIIVKIVAGGKNYDPLTLCPEDGNYPRTAVLLDATDRLCESQAKKVEEEIINNLLKQPDHDEWVGIFILHENNLTLPAPEIALCSPGKANPLIQNPEWVQRRFEEKFQKPMAAAIKRLIQTSPHTTSPIHEMIKAVALDRNFDDPTKKRRLIVISDMLQHTPPEYSHYRDGADFQVWRNSIHGRDFPQFSLSDVEVEVLYLKRTGDLARSVQNNEDHILFWKNYFSELGASIEWSPAVCK
ncbi:MAG: hypothetical protein ACR2P9_02325 [Gammaproteobacteria bacterium]